MHIKVNTNFDLSKLNIWRLNLIWLENSSREIQATARVNAPIDTGKLKQGIAIEKSLNKARIGPRSIPYAVRREFENKKNPHKKFYMKKTHEVSWPIVEKAFQEAYNIVIKSIWRS